MSDPSYDNGVNVDSVVDMVRDIGEVFLGNTNYVTAPKPIEGTGPMTHITFKDDSDNVPKDLNIARRRSSQKNVSRRLQSYGVVHPNSALLNMESAKTSNTKGINVAVADLEQTLGTVTLGNDNTDDEYIVEEDNIADTSTRHPNQSVSRKSEAQINENVVGRPARRVAYRGAA